MSGFSNFAISFSVICVIAGGITSLQLGTSAVGGAAAGVVWPIGFLLCLPVALCMAQVASAFPTAGGLYHWSSILGGRGWGWATAWFNLVGLVFVTASVNVGTYNLFTAFIGPLLGIDPAKLTLVHQFIGVVLIGASQALCNQFGIRLTSLLTDFSGYLIVAVAVVLTTAMLVYAPTHDFRRLIAFTNASGSAGGDIWPSHPGIGAMILLGLLWPVYTISGYDASANTSEETLDAARNVPRGILRAVGISGIAGWVMVISFIVAAPDLTEAVKQGGNVFPWLMEKVLPATLGRVVWIGIVAGNYLCGLACTTSTSRMVYAFARDGGLPNSKALRRVSASRRTPTVAIWTVMVAAAACTLYAPAYSTLTTVTVIFLYISYVMPTAAGLKGIGQGWTRMGPFNLGTKLFRLLGALSVAFVVMLIGIGVQPPNEKALPVAIAMTALLVAAWWLGVRRAFAGPPNAALLQSR
jgi:amino acid transporter